ncbi:extracellular matrix-binding protein ebh isoform X4 [Danio aesculapii]|uniref:extracellular matrix-binding protein ebh isoform X4 n=1 Tax=Danio aesculapii TaxID=1142201 RepID=UPI0024C0D92B|nr:extracellular matrix-binding protein ebh isoform X4 [Danio aesculapii]
MGSQGPGRKRTPSKNGLTAEEDALNVIAKEAEARLAAKRAARAEAREIRMKELERQQKEIYQVQKKYYGLDNLDNKWGDIEQWMEDSERYTRVSRRHASVSDDEERMSVGSRSNVRLDLDATGAYGAASSSYSHKKSKKKKKHSSKTSNGYDDDLSTLSSRSSRLSDESKRSRSSRLDLQSGSIYEDSLYGGSRRSSARAVRMTGSSEYSGLLGSSSRTSSRANSACGSPVEDCSSSVASFKRSTASISGLSRDLDNIVIPDLPNVNGRMSLADDRLERDYLEKGSSRASTISGATLTSLGGTSSRRGSGDTSISADTEASIREIKEIHELKDQIHDVEAKHMQNLKELKDSLLEVEEKYRKAMVSNAQLDNEKTNMMYEVDTLKDSLMELEEMLFETRRELEEKIKDLEREKHAHSVLQFQFGELKETLKQSEELLTDIRQLRLKQDGFVREISDLQETIEWKNKKIGALERQKEFSDAIRNERDELRDEVVQLKDVLKKHGIVLGPDLATNGETGDEVGNADPNSQTASAEIREGSSVLGIHQLKHKDQEPKYLDEEVQGNQQSSHAPFSSTNTPLEVNDNSVLGDPVIPGVEQHKNRPEEPLSSVGDEELTTTAPKEEVKSEEHELEDSRDNAVELEHKVQTYEHLETEQQDGKCVTSSQEIKEEAPLDSVSNTMHDETDKPGEALLDEKCKEEPVESPQMEEPPKTQVTSASNKKKKKKKKNKQKQKQSDKQESGTAMEVLNEDNSNQKVESVLEGTNEEPLENAVSETTMNVDLPASSCSDITTKEQDCIEVATTNTNVDGVQDSIQLVTDEVDSAEISKTISNFDCSESSNVILSEGPSNNIISNTTDDPSNNIICNTADDVSNNTISDTEDDLSNNIVSDTADDLSNNIVSDTADDLSNNIVSDTADDLSNNIVSDTADDLSNNIISDTADDLSNNIVSDTVDDLSNDIITNTADDLSNDSITNTADDLSNDIITNTADDLSNDSITNTADDPSNKIISDPATIIEERAEDSANSSLEPAITCSELKSSEMSASSHEPSFEPITSENNETMLVDAKEEKVDLECQEEPSPQNVGVDEICDPEDQEAFAQSDFHVMETIENKAELMMQEQTIDLPMDSQLQDSVESEVGKEKEQGELDKENLEAPKEEVFARSKVDNSPFIETQVQVVQEDNPSANEANQESAEPSDQNSMVEKVEEEMSIQGQVTPDGQLPKDDNDLLIELDVVGLVHKQEDADEEDEGESFDFDETDLEASSDGPLKKSLDQPKEEVTLLKENVQEASQENQSNVIDEDLTQEDEHLQLAEQESKPDEQKDDVHDTENLQPRDVEGCLTEQSLINHDVSPVSEQHDTPGNKEDTLEEHQKASVDVPVNERVNLISEKEKREVGQEISTSIPLEKQASMISGDPKLEKEITRNNKEDESRESRKSAKGKGKSKGKEDCKMS